MTQLQQAIAQSVERIVHAVDPQFWVPAVGNGQLGALLLYLEQHNLWPDIRALLPDSVREAGKS